MELNTNTTTNTAANAAFLKDFYDRKLLDTAKTQFCFQLYGQKRPIPRNNGKKIEFRRYNLFEPDTETLSLLEGVTPDGQALSQSTVEATVKQYGAYVTISDLLDVTAIDPVQRDASVLLGDQLGRTIEWVIRNIMIAGASAQYANGRSSKFELTRKRAALTSSTSYKALSTTMPPAASSSARAAQSGSLWPCSPNGICSATRPP